MHRVLVLGAGKIGALIAGLLEESGDYTVTLADSRPGAAAEVAAAHQAIAGSGGIQALDLDATRLADLEVALSSHRIDAVVSSLPYYLRTKVVAAGTRSAWCQLRGRHHDGLANATARGATCLCRNLCGVSLGC